MFAAALAAVGSAFAIESANIVGYTTDAVAAGTVYRAIGPAMMSVGADHSFKLGDVLKPGATYDFNNDYVYVVDPATGDGINQLCYIDATSAEGMGIDEGWYDFQAGTPFNDEVFAIGTGFQASFAGNALEFTSSGEVCKDGYSVDCTGITYGYPVNATGRAITWSQIGVSAGYDFNNDYFYTLNPETGDGIEQLCYIDATSAEGMGIDEGWYDFQAGTPFNSVELAPGDGVQASVSGNAFTLDFPALED